MLINNIVDHVVDRELGADRDVAVTKSFDYHSAFNFSQIGAIVFFWYIDSGETDLSEFF